MDRPSSCGRQKNVSGVPVAMTNPVKPHLFGRRSGFGQSMDDRYSISGAEEKNSEARTNHLNDEITHLHCSAFALLPAANADMVLTTLLHFSRDGTNISGYAPRGAMIQATDGNLYGTTEGYFTYFSTQIYGSVFRLSMGGHFQSITLFTESSSGTCPQGPSRPACSKKIRWQPVWNDIRW